MNRVIILFLLLLCLKSYSQIKVVNQDLVGIEGVQVLSDNQVVGLSDKSGFADVNIRSITTSYIVLVHQSFYEKRILVSELDFGLNTFMLSPRTQNFPTVVVRPGEGRITRKKDEVPIRLESISKKELGFFQPPTMAEAITIGQKVYVQKSQAGGGSPILRGFSTNRILLVVDDVRMNTAIFRSGNVQNVVSIDPNALEKSQVLFGPASQLYGSDAIGGVLLFTTKKPTYGQKDSIVYEGNIGLRIASANVERSWHFDFNVGTEKFASFTSLSFNSYGHTKMGKNGPSEYQRPTYVARVNGKDTQAINPDPNSQLFSSYNQLNALQKFEFKPNEKVTLGYNFHYSQTGDVHRYDRLLLSNNNGQLENAQWYYGPQKWMMNHLSLIVEAENAILDQVKINIANQQFEESRNDRKFGSDWLRNRTENVSATSINVDALKNINNSSKINYGAEYVHNLVNSTAHRSNVVDNMSASTSTRYPDGATWQSIGAYLNYYYKWNRHWITESGVRYNTVTTNAIFDTAYFKFPETEFTNANDALTGTVSHMYKGDKGQISAVLSSAFRSPNIDDLAKVFDSNPGTVVIPNADLMAEYAYNAELNATRKVGKNLKLQASVFYTRLQNALATVNTQFNGQDSILYDGTLSQVQQIQNVDFAEIAGLQLNGTYVFSEAVNLESNFTFLESGFNAVMPVRHITPHFGGSYLNYKKNNWYLSLYSMYNLAFTADQFSINELQDEFLYLKDESGKPYSPAWATFNIRGAYQWTSNVVLNLAVENILNKRYRPYSSGISAPGLNLVISMKASF